MDFQNQGPTQTQRKVGGALRRLSAVANAVAGETLAPLSDQIEAVASILDPCSLDLALSNLYLSSDLLEKKCASSMKQSLCNPVNHTSIPSTTNAPCSSAKSSGLHSSVPSLFGGPRTGNHSHIVSDKTPESVIEGLRPDFFSPSFDPVHDQLLEISQWGVRMDTTVTERFMMKIEDADTDKDMILSKLADMIEANYGELMSCMRDVNAIDADLTRATVQVGGGRRKIAAAAEKMNKGGIRISKLQSSREQLSLLGDMLKSLKGIKDIYNAMQSSITTGEVGRAAELACRALEILSTDTYSKFVSLHGLASGIQKSIFTIRYKTDKALMRLCGRKFASSEYNTIIRAYLALDSIAENMGLQIIDPQEGSLDENHSILYDAAGCMEGLAARIQRFQFQDIENCLHTAVLEFMYASQHKKRKAAAELSIAGVYSPMNIDDMVDLSEIDLPQLYQRVTPDMVGPCIVRSCELLADAVHTHYLITQWHYAPLDPRNDDMMFLHRCQNDSQVIDKFSIGAELDITKESMELETPCLGGDVSKTLISPTATSGIAYDTSLSAHLLKDKPMSESLRGGDTTSILGSSFSPQAECMKESRLNYAYQRLVQNRSVLWEQLLSALVDMMNCINMTAAVSADDFLAITWAINAMIILGKEFCGSECKVLSGCLKEKSKEYFFRLHIESSQILRQIVTAELWRSVPVRLGEIGGILGIIKMNLTKASSSAMKAGGLRSAMTGMHQKEVNDLVMSSMREECRIRMSASISPSPQKSSTILSNSSILMLFGRYGNPLHFMTDGETGNSSGAASNSHAQPEATEDELNNMENAQGHEKKFLDDFSVILEDESNVKTQSDSKEANLAAMLVVTQSSMNGLARYTGSYLQIMNMMPSAATEVFNGLCQLFDFYLCTVYNGFVPSEEKVKLFSKSKQTISAQEQSKDFDVLQSYLERALEQTIQTGETRMEVNNPLSESSFPAELRASFSSASASFASTVNSSSSAAVATLSAAAFPSSSTMSAVASTLSSSSPSLSSSSSNSIPFSHPSSTQGATTYSSTTTSSYLPPTLSPANLFAVESFKLSSLLTTPSVIETADISNYFGMRERIVAAESCWFAAKILDEVKFKILLLLPDRSVNICEGYISQFQIVSDQLRSYIYKSMCPQLIKHGNVMALIESSGWEHKKIRERHHEWVDLIISNCQCAWNYLLEERDSTEVFDWVRERVWMELCQAAFDVVLDGFSRVRKCSPEGRAAMKMDIDFLDEGLNSIHSCHPPRGKHYIENFLQATYMQEEGWSLQIVFFTFKLQQLTPKRFSFAFYVTFYNAFDFFPIRFARMD